jgi:PASTA domain
MKEATGLLAAIIGLATAVIVLLAALNKTGTVEVPVIREVSVLQPSNEPPPPPTATEITESTTDTVPVPEVLGLTEDDAKNKLAEQNLVPESGETVPMTVCEPEALSAGEVESTDPSIGEEVNEGSTVVLHVCE